MSDQAKTTLRLPADLLVAARHRAIDEGLTFQALIERALRLYLKTPRKRQEARR